MHFLMLACVTPSFILGLEKRVSVNPTSDKALLCNALETLNLGYTDELHEG